MVDQSVVQNVDAAQPSPGGGERAVARTMADMAQDGDNLSLCAAIFCDGDLSRYRDLYTAVFRSDSETPNDHRRVSPNWRRRFVDIFRNLRQAPQL